MGSEYYSATKNINVLMPATTPTDSGTWTSQLQYEQLWNLVYKCPERGACQWWLRGAPESEEGLGWRVSLTVWKWSILDYGVDWIILWLYKKILNYNIKWVNWATKMAHQVKSSVLAEDLSSVPSTYANQFTATFNSSFRGSVSLAFMTPNTHTHTHTHTH